MFITSDKVAAPLHKLKSVVMVGFADHIAIQWATDVSYPQQTVEMIFRKSDNTDEFNIVTTNARDVGSMATPYTLEEGVDYTIWIRPVDPLYYGEWQATVATAIDGWISGVEAVTHNGELVYFNSELVVAVKQ